MSLVVTSSCPGGIHAPARAPVFVPKPVKVELSLTGFDRLTPRERELIERTIVTGVLKIAAAEMGIKQKTAEAHMLNAREKTGHRNAIHLAIAYERWARGAN